MGIVWVLFDTLILLAPVLAAHAWPGDLFFQTFQNPRGQTMPLATRASLPGIRFPFDEALWLEQPPSPREPHPWALAEP